MKKFLIDVNLPYMFSLWNSDEFVHQKDINDAWTDEQIWDYARERNLTIVTKDSDFSHRIIFSTPPPRIIHIRFGNLKMNEFHQTITSSWINICELSEKYKLVNVFKDRIEGVN